MRASKFITESFNQPYDYRWQDKSNKLWKGQFETKENHPVDLYIHEANLSIEDEEQFGDDNNWRMEFTRSGTIKLTESGDSIKIFAIIISMIEDFVINMKPNNIFFLSSTDNKDKSRVKLYDALINRFASKHGYMYSTRTSTQHSDLEYIFSRK